MASGIEKFATKIRLPLIPVNEASKIFERLLLDNPLYFHRTPPMEEIIEK